MNEDVVDRLLGALKSLDTACPIGFCVQREDDSGMRLYRQGLARAAAEIGTSGLGLPASSRSLPALRRTRLGRPRPIIDHRLTSILGRKPKAADLHVSYTHDGGIHITALAHAPGLCGLGIDVVHLPRLSKPRHTPEYLHRFASSFMSEEELDVFRIRSAEDDLDALRVRVAKHFSLMEAASKALGTGLRLGAGMGLRGGVRPRSISLNNARAKTIEFTAEAGIRCKRLSVVDTSYCAISQSDYVISIVSLGG